MKLLRVRDQHPKADWVVETPILRDLHKVLAGILHPNRLLGFTAQHNWALRLRELVPFLIHPDSVKVSAGSNV
jgi:hypothetical protein